jgi:hypothetical protein
MTVSETEDFMFRTSGEDPLADSAEVGTLGVSRSGPSGVVGNVYDLEMTQPESGCDIKYLE